MNSEEYKNNHAMLSDVTKKMLSLEPEIKRQQEYIRAHGTANDLDPDSAWNKYKLTAEQNLEEWDTLRKDRDRLKSNLPQAIRALEIYLTEGLIDSLSIFTQSALPDIYYHATRQNFLEFDETKKGINTDGRNTFQGFFFAEMRTIELICKDNPKDFGNVILKVRLNIQNPFDMTIPGMFVKENQAATFWEILSGDQVTNKRALKLLNKHIGLGEMGDVWDALRNEEAHAIMVKNGHDGIIKDIGDGNEYVAFNSNQIQILSKEAIIHSYIKGINRQLRGELDLIVKNKTHKNRIKL